MTKTKDNFPIWQGPQGDPVSCVEKIRVLNDNFVELREMMQDALEDALLMGCDESQFRSVMLQMVNELDNPYAKK